MKNPPCPLCANDKDCWKENRKLKKDIQFYADRCVQRDAEHLEIVKECERKLAIQKMRSEDRSKALIETVKARDEANAKVAKIREAAEIVCTHVANIEGSLSHGKTPSSLLWRIKDLNKALSETEERKT